MTMKSSKLDTAIILISEITKGMKSIGSKALLPLIDSVTILDYQIHYIKKNYNPSQIVLCTGFDHDRIIGATKKYKNIKYHYNDNYISHNQSGSLVKCIKDIPIKNALIFTNGLIVFDKIKLQDKSSTYFINNNMVDKKNTFDIGTNTINKEGYLFYDLSHKWIEVLYLNETDTQTIKRTKQELNQLFLFELINEIRKNHHINFIELNDIRAIKINSLKDITYAKKIYKKYSSISC